MNMNTKLLLLLVCLPVWARAEVYKVPQEDGSVLFTNVYTPEAKVVKIKPVTTVAVLKLDKPAAVPLTPSDNPGITLAPITPPKPTAIPSPAMALPTMRLSFVAPIAGQAVLASDQPLSVVVRASPELLPTQRMQLVLNNTFLAAGNNTVLQLDKLAVGRHVLRADVLSGDNAIISSQSTEFFILQPIAVPGQ
jgi:hypothetical protein